MAAALVGLIMAPTWAHAANPKNIFLTFVDLIDQDFGNFCIPETIAVTPNSELVYVAAYDPTADEGEVFAINALNDTIIASIEVSFGEGPFGVAIDPAGQNVYVSVPGTTALDGGVVKIDIANNLLVNEYLPSVTGPFPEGLAVSKLDGTLWIANAGTSGFNNGTVSVINPKPAGGANVALIPVGGEATQVVFNSTGKKAYVENFAGLGYVSVINTANFAITNNSFGLGIINDSFYGLAVTPTTVIVGGFTESVYEFNFSGTLKKDFKMFLPSVPLNEQGLGQTAVTTNAKFLFVAEPDVSSIGWVNLVTGKVETLHPIFTGGFPIYLAISPNDNTLYEADQDFDGIGVIDIQQ